MIYSAFWLLCILKHRISSDPNGSSPLRVRQGDRGGFETTILTTLPALHCVPRGCPTTLQATRLGARLHCFELVIIMRWGSGLRSLPSHPEVRFRVQSNPSVFLSQPGFARGFSTRAFSSSSWFRRLAFSVCMPPYRCHQRWNVVLVTSMTRVRLLSYYFS